MLTIASFLITLTIFVAMSSKINIKDIIIKQKEKFSATSWGEILNTEFDKPAFESFMQKLVNQVEKGIKFAPPMKDWFTDLQAVELDNLKVVIISKERVEQLPHFMSIEGLEEQGVLFYPLERTASNNVGHIEDWRMFNISFVDYLVTQKPNLIYVFIGFDASQFSDLVGDESEASKIFLPELTHDIYQKHVVHELFSTNVNELLEKHDISAVNW